ncbi:hypothetical protein RAS1_06710 [Phycisphaerae bacterium RAS1]|nr:hypothetical protein RAS1_06710 [Phycisphaerae bacterium RAS1]
MRYGVGLGVIGALASVALADLRTFRETYSGSTNHGNWSYFGDPGTGIEVVETSGGNPGAFWHSTCNQSELLCLDTYAPQPRTQLGVNSRFVGNYRARQVTALGIDLVLFYVDFSAAGRPLTVMLRGDAGTPGDPSDDYFVYRLEPYYVPEVGDGWRSFTFAIPSQNLTLPLGWSVLNGSGDNNADWNAAITSVAQVVFFYGDPEFFFIFQQWEPGLDNPRITRNVLVGDLNCDGEVNILDINAFTLALADETAYAAEYPKCDSIAADVNDDGEVNVLDINPFVALIGG